jgi:hypothetical protein
MKNAGGPRFTNGRNSNQDFCSEIDKNKIIILFRCSNKAVDVREWMGVSGMILNENECK